MLKFWQVKMDYGRTKSLLPEFKTWVSISPVFAFYYTRRIQIVGQSETSYLEQLKSEQRIEAINNLDLDKISCVLITRNLSTLIETAVRIHLLRDSGFDAAKTLVETHSAMLKSNVN